MMRDMIEKVCSERGWGLDGNAVTVSLPSGRKQVVHFQESEASGEKLLRVFSVLGDAGELDARRLRAALRLSWTLPWGAVAIGSLGDGPEQLLLSETALADNLNRRRLSLAIQGIASTADRYEGTVFGTDDH